MSKNFEKEYMEYLNAQAPDLWDRIEAGLDAKVVPISGEKAKKARKKRRIRYQNYRMLASVAACLLALVIIVPVYLLTGAGAKSETASDAAPKEVENVTIQNLVVDASESMESAEDAAPMEEAAEAVTEIAIPEETLQEGFMMAEEATEQSAAGTEDAEITSEIGSGENVGQVAGTQESEKDGAVSDLLMEGQTGQQEEMTVTILGEGTLQEGGVMYAAAKNESEASVPVSLFVPDEAGIVFATDGVYTVTVQISQDGSFYEVLSVTE